jgi:hypothetical protein
MTKDEWNKCRNPDQMMCFLATTKHSGNLALFACACCGRIWDLLQDARLVDGVETRERFERGAASAAEAEQAKELARHARREIRWSLIRSNKFNPCGPEVAQAWAAGAAANAAAGGHMGTADLAARAMAFTKQGDWQENYESERATQCDLLRSMVAYPG